MFLGIFVISHCPRRKWDVFLSEGAPASEASPASFVIFSFFFFFFALFLMAEAEVTSKNQTFPLTPLRRL